MRRNIRGISDLENFIPLKPDGGPRVASPLGEAIGQGGRERPSGARVRSYKRPHRSNMQLSLRSDHRQISMLTMIKAAT